MKKAKKTKKFTLSITDKKGKVIHSFHDQDAAKIDLMRHIFYRVLVSKMKQKVRIRAKAS